MDNDVKVFFDIEREKWACRISTELFQNMVDGEDEEKYSNESLRMVFQEITKVETTAEMNFFMQDENIYIWEDTGTADDIQIIKEFIN